MKHRRLLFALFVTAGLWIGGSPAHSATTHRVITGSYFFNPTNLTVMQGDSVVWTNTSLISHDSTQGTASTPTASRLWISPNMPAFGGNFRFTFTNMGVYPYICLQHINTQPQQTGTVSVIRGNFGPAVTMTTPGGGTRHPAPPNFVAMATATDPDGAVTNVFFTATAASVGTVSVGSDATAPYSVLVTNLPPASYQFRAVATDNEGLSSTSAVVNILIATPVPLVLSGRGPTAQNQFQLGYPTTLGLQYVVEESSEVNGGWTSVSTNSGSGATLTNNRPFEVQAPAQRFYRAFIQP